MTEYSNNIISAFQEVSNAEIAKGQSAYMKNHFAFFGIKSPERKALQRSFFRKDQTPKKEDLPQVIRILWEQPQRELQYCAQELALKYVKNQDKWDLELYEYMVTHKSWWDTVDFIASNLVGAYFKNFPEEKETAIKKWLASEHIWLQRTALLFQLKYKDQLDTSLLKYIITRLLGSDEFFINKAVGWILREYSKTNPHWVLAFVEKHELHPLSKREALKWLSRKKL
jgi:3-methyladenine DNA glycosylase AlkD